MITLGFPYFEEVIEHSKREYPNEACGILAGKNGQVKKVYPMTNIEKSPLTYLADPREQFKVIKEMRKLGLELVGIYHSHPESEPYPSKRDLEMAFYPEAIYLIISLKDIKKPKVKAFRIKDSQFEEVKIKVNKEVKNGY